MNVSSGDSAVATIATVVARKASPPFTLVSYRRQAGSHVAKSLPNALIAALIDMTPQHACFPHTMRRSAAETAWTLHSQQRAGFFVPFSEADDPQGMQTADGWLQHSIARGQDETNFANFARTSARNFRIANPGVPNFEEATEEAYAAQGGNQLQYQVKTLRTSTEFVSLHPARTRATMRSQLDPPPLMMQVNRCEICLEPQTLHASGLPREAVELLRTLLVLQRFVLAVPLSAYDFCFESMDFRVRHRWLVKLAPANPSRQRDVSYYAAAMPQMASKPAAISTANVGLQSLQHQHLTGRNKLDTVGFYVTVAEGAATLRRPAAGRVFVVAGSPNAGSSDGNWGP
ncbi:hypothetical protein ON010_g8403 [Phytophthora cinnamomi]|nr:hypothetical protein ON010_g8403 [Phytophthora cinnamomi]